MTPTEASPVFLGEALVVLLHGLWCNRAVMAILSRRLRRCSGRVARFGYSSVGRSPAQNATILSHWLQQQPESTVHYVAHSLGGLVLSHLFAQCAHLPLGRVVLLGTPLNGSRVAARLARLPGGRFSLGASLHQGLLGGAPAWPRDREIGVVAGTVGIGLGTLLGGVGSPGDGAVAVSETRGPGLIDHVQVRTSHTGLLFSADAAEQACTFLRLGRFLH